MNRNFSNSTLCAAPYFIADVEVIPIDGVMIHDGEVIKIPARAIQVLAYFIAHAGSVVTYDKINVDIWSGKLSENGFYQLIALLRKLLSDDSKKPKYIKTIAKQGYMFIGIDSVKFKKEINQVSFTEDKHVKNRIDLNLLLAMISLAALIIVSMYYFRAIDEVDSHSALYDLVDKLAIPESTVIIERLEVNTDDEKLQAISDSLVLLSQYHLAWRPGQHVAITPVYKNSAIGIGENLYKKLFSHYKSSRLSYIYRPRVLFDSSGEWLFSLTQINAQTQDVLKLFEFSSQENDLPKAVSMFEKKMLSQFQLLSLLADKNVPLFNAAVGVEEFVEAAADSFILNNTQQAVERKIRLNQQAIDANPKNLLAYSMMWKELIKLISVHHDFDPAAAFQLLDNSIIKANKISPDYYWTALISACRYCWLEDYTQCASNYSLAMKLYTANPVMLSGIFWNITGRPDLQLPLAQYNYTLNPFDDYAFANYRNALITSGDFNAMAELVDYHSAWSDSKNWFVQMQSQTNMNLLQRQAKDYRADSLIDVDGLLRDIPHESLPSRYSGYAMLNVNRPDLARFWVQNGMERELEYFDLTVVELLADLWQGQWQPQQWQVARADVMQRRRYQNTLDKLTIAYFDRQTGWLSKSSDMLVALYPALLDDDAIINEGNLRFFVYYSDLQKRLGNYKYANKGTQKIKLYLNQRSEDEYRGVDFGIADVEFYALNYDHDKALDLLEDAVYKQDWLPNALWLWPPLERNQFLESLHNNARFNAVVEHINSKLQSLCLDNCPL